MPLREDEIEAILKFDNASLEVVFRDDLMAQANALYTAIIKYQKITLARPANTRSAAVQAVWETYKRYRMDNPDSEVSGVWVYENAMGDVEVQLRKLLEEKRNGKQ